MNEFDDNDNGFFGDEEYDNFPKPNKFDRLFDETNASKMKKEAVKNDRLLQDLAVYELTKGLTVALVNIRETLPVFAEYKRLVKRGSFTIEQLEERVLNKYAIITELTDTIEPLDFMDEEPETNYGAK